MIRDNRYEVFKRIFKASQSSLLQAMKEYFKEVYGEGNIIYNDKYIVAKGDIPVALVAHLDVVFDNVKEKDIFYDRENQIIWSPQGLGADDRAGVFSILDIIETTDLRPTVILTTDEEIGGIGASALVSDIKQCPVDLKFIIELDRSGFDDAVYYDCNNLDFENYISDFGFISDWGSFSDISFICPAWEIAGVNLSIGYFNEHKVSEYLDVTWMHKTVEKVKEILQKADVAPHFKYEEKVSLYRAAGLRGETCWGCFRTVDEELMITVGSEIYCGDCYAKLYSTCDRCGEIFYNEDKINIECYECRSIFK